MNRTALVISYAEINKDPRVRNQIQWLQNGGFRVDTLGRGTNVEVNGTHFELRRWPLLIRLFSYLFLPNVLRYKLLVQYWVNKTNVIKDLSPNKYDLILLNTIDFLPSTVELNTKLLNNQGKILLDLHEYSPSQGIGVLWALLFKRYQNWLVSMIPNRNIDIRTTVSDGIAELYAKEFTIPRPVTIYNVPPFQELKPRKVEVNKIKLIHHGKADLARGLTLMLEAMTMVEPRFELTLMLVGSPSDQNGLAKLRDSLNLQKRVVFIEPVAMDLVASKINEFDAELIYFPPETENLRYVLPNKYFEAVQGRVAIISGPSPEIMNVSKPFSNAIFTNSWDVFELAQTINSLKSEQIEYLKQGSASAARELNSQTVGEKFLATINN